jgi:hypothetical protein
MVGVAHDHILKQRSIQHDRHDQEMGFKHSLPIAFAPYTGGRATPGYDTGAKSFGTNRLVRIRSSKDKPADAYVAVRYRETWFWIDDHDLRTKRAFAFMMMLFTLSESGEKENMPLITIPAQ